LHHGRHLGLRYRMIKGAGSTAGLATVEGAIFALGIAFGVQDLRRSPAL
jgi:hypothetical protein